jgi:hypothetical protein
MLAIKQQGFRVLGTVVVDDPSPAPRADKKHHQRYRLIGHGWRHGRPLESAPMRRDEASPCLAFSLGPAA